ncbi:hypothetical protein [Methanofollis fontis]|uniref:Uncharacterized protein n=1 Tax=Methanofollis fontis TaxID=2052832 RepID=A0A483CL00_9EURY|nr:hypothetical protein [Methanofollis fontis]TAJ43628.1 hypothetical protein CUJ86_09790 [Methanofollis fontis]
MELINREREHRPPNEDLLRGTTETSFLNGKAVTTRTDPIRDLEYQRTLVKTALADIERLIVRQEQQTTEEVEEEYLLIRRHDKRDIRLLNLSNAEKRAAEVGRRLGAQENYQNLCDSRDRLLVELARLRIEIEFQRREFVRALAEQGAPYV